MMGPKDLLAGVSVVEAGGGPAVAVAGRLLADLGATVTKVMPCVEARSPAWALVLDEGKTIRDPADLSEVADGGKVRMLLLGDPDPSLPEVERCFACPRPTVVRVDAAGVDDLLWQAAAGICAGIGEPGRPPLKLPLDQSAQQGGLTLALAACASLLSNVPQEIVVSALDVWIAFFMGPDVANARFGRSKTRRGGHRGVGVPWPRTILACEDGYFAVQCATRDHWQRFLKLVDRPDLEGDALFADRIKANDERGEEADAAFAGWFARRTKAEILRDFLAAKLPGAPVLTIDEVAEQEHLRGRDAFRVVRSGEADVLAVNPPFLLHGAGRPAPPLTLGRDAAAPLEGVRVLDFGWVWAGAVPGHILADLGAQVIKVETSTRLDYMRQGRPIVGTARDPEQNPMFQAVNRGKLSLTVDMTKPEGAAILRDLAAASDVVIENFAPGVLDRHDLGWKALSGVNSGLVMCSLSAAGATGVLRDLRTYAMMIGALCGLDSMVGYPGERVLGSQSSYADPNASLHAALAILAALYRRAHGGEGCWIDLSQWQAGLRTVDAALAQWSVDGRVPSPNGLAREDRIVHGCYPAAGHDEWIALSVRDANGWATLRAALDGPASLPAEPTDEDRRAIATALAEETRRFSARDLARRLRGHGIAEAVATADQLADDPRIRAGALFEDVEHPLLGSVPVYRLPWLVNGKRLSVRSRAPRLGEHNDDVLKGILKLSDERLADLREANVLS